MSNPRTGARFQTCVVHVVLSSTVSMDHGKNMGVRSPGNSGARQYTVRNLLKVHFIHVTVQVSDSVDNIQELVCPVCEALSSK